jgi:hypothetical protein
MNTNTKGGRSSRCTIKAVAQSADGFEWRWYSADSGRRSAHAYQYFYECLQDARRHGFAVDVPGIVDELRKLSDRSPEATH